MEPADLAQVVALIRRQRWAALATLRRDEPYCSSVAYAPAPDCGCFWLHLSRLAPHTQNLLKNPAVSLSISDTDDGRADPQTLARLTVQGKVEVLERDTPEYQNGQALYIERLPAAEPLFDFGDFMLLRLAPRALRYVGGFARAYSITPAELIAAAHQSRAG